MINMDTGSGFDGQTLVGSGVEATIRYLNEIDKKEIVSHVQDLRKSNDLENLTGWERRKIEYFYADR